MKDLSTLTIQEKFFKMQSWSDSPIHPKFTTKFFIDTNILIYLVDNSYQSLTDFIETIKECPFVELVSSKYVIFEFVGVRKREHYLRLAADSYLKLPDGKINFSSIIKYKDGYSIPKASFDDLKSDIQKNVNNELEKISTELNIKYEYSSLHEDQLAPTFDVCLTSKISNQDSLVLISAVLPQQRITHDNVILLTNDGSFVSFFEDAKVEDTLRKHAIMSPITYSIDKIPISGGGHISLTQTNTKDQLLRFSKSKILELITKRTFMLGKTFIPNKSLPDGVVCFKLNKATTVKKDIYITILSKDLDFIYTSKKRIKALQQNGVDLADGYTSPSDNKINVAFKLVDINEVGDEIPVNTTIITAIQAEDNYVLIHPDS